MVAQLVPLGLVMAVNFTPRTLAPVSAVAWVRFAHRMLALGIQSLAPVPSNVKFVAVVHVPVNELKAPPEKLKPDGAVQAPKAVVQAWNFSPWIAAVWPGTKAKV